MRFLLIFLTCNLCILADCVAERTSYRYTTLTPTLRCAVLGGAAALERRAGKNRWRQTTQQRELTKTTIRIRSASKALRAARGLPKARRTRTEQRARRQIATLRELRAWIVTCFSSNAEDPTQEPPPQDSPPADAPPTTPPSAIHQCNDGIDNDGDSWIDGLDGDCSDGGHHEQRIARTLCEDGIDNDGDGSIDSDDDGCSSDRDPSERGIEGTCSNGLDDDGDGLTDYPFDPGCASPSSAEQQSDDPPQAVRVVMGVGRWLEGPTLQLREAPGIIESILWRESPDEDSEREVIGYFEDRGLDVMSGNPTRFFLHSAVRLIDDTGGRAWKYGPTSTSITSQVAHAHVSYSDIDEHSFQVEHAPTLRITTSVKPAASSVLIQSRIENLSAEARFYEVPVYLPYFLFPTHEGSVRIRGEMGGSISRNFAQGTNWEYPGVNSFGPMTALWQEPTGEDSKFTVGVSVPSHIHRPDGVTFLEENRRIEVLLRIRLNAGESKDFTVAVGIAPAMNWQAALAPYKRWFQYHHSVVPSYCPPGPFVSSSGTNTAQYDHTIKRFRAGTDMQDLFPTSRIPSMAGWFQFAGFWETAIDSIYASPNRHVQKESWVHLFDPNIEFRSDGSLAGYLSHFSSAALETLWFTRPNFGLEGYSVTTNGSGGHVFTPGVVLDLDYTYARDREIYLSYLDPLARAGVTAFYVDAFDAPGGPAFIHYVANELRKRYGKQITMIVEGNRDTFSMVSAQIPVIGNAEFEGGDPRFGLLFEWLTPYATFYGGRVNAPLSAENTETFVERGIQYQPIPLQGFPNTPSREFCRWVNKAYLNRSTLHQLYGSSLTIGGVEQCSEPAPPPLPIDRCDELPSFTGW